MNKQKIANDMTYDIKERMMKVEMEDDVVLRNRRIYDDDWNQLQ